MYVLGQNCKLYLQLVGPRESWPVVGCPPNIVEVGITRDLTLTSDVGTADVSRRGCTWREELPALKELSIEFQVVRDVSDVTYLFLESSWSTGVEFGVAVLDGDANDEGSKGIWFSGTIAGFEEGQELEEAVTTSITIKNAGGGESV